MKLLFWTSFWVFLADQITKYAVVHGLGLISDDDGRITVFPGFFEFRMAWNRGVNFGLGAGYDLRWVLIGVACAISAFVVIWLSRSKATRTLLMWRFLSGRFVWRSRRNPPRRNLPRNRPRDEGLGLR